MRLMTWNVNGIKTLLQYNPWNTLKNYENILNELGADIICFQETKITKKQVDRGMAVLPSFDSFFSSYSRKPEKGYSGTCVFTKRSTVVPLKAEEGISGLLPLDRRPEPSNDELIGGTLSPTSIALNMQDVKTIDLEGRTTMVDLGLFVLINLYCPNETNEERLDFKLAFNAMLEARILNLIRLGRQVIILGDLNICAKAIDHCDPVRRASDHPAYGGFENHPARKWFNEFVGPKGSMVDLGRHFYPERKSMFTHWETRINARETNYGSRIDYICATPGLLPWIKTCEIQPQILGSDHCPVIADFHDSITTEGGETLYLWDHINTPGRSKEPDAPAPEAPKLAAKFYPEFSSEQRLLSNFFGKRGMATASASPASSSPSTAKPSSSLPSSSAPAANSGKIVSPNDSASLPSASAPVPTSLLNAVKGAPSSSSAPFVPPPLSPALAPPPSPSIDLTLADTDEEDLDRKASTSSQPPPSRSPSVVGGSNGSSGTKKKAKKGQQTIASFFKPPPPPPKETKARDKAGKMKSVDKGKGKAKEETEEALPEDEHRDDEIVVQEAVPTVENDDDVIELKAKALNGGSSSKKRKKSLDGNESDEIRDAIAVAAGNEEASTAWSSIFSAKVPPLCTMHNEPCKQWTVNKSGLNKGRVFWLCARPVGEGYDKGQAKADVNPEYRCNYFKWETDIKRTAPISSGFNKKKKALPHGQG